MLRRLHPEQPDSFAFTPANQAWAEAQITKYPEGRQASAIIPLLWRAQEQEGWLSRPAIEEVARMLDMAYIRALEVATFYFMFQLQPVGSVAHIQICGTTSCMICGAEDLISVCKDKISPRAHELSADGKLSWEEVECLGACANAPMAQIGKDYYEDLTTDGFAKLLDDLSAGQVPTPGPQNGRYASEPASGLTSLEEYAEGRHPLNASAGLADDLGDTVKRIDGTEVPLTTPWRKQGDKDATPVRDDLLGPKGPDGRQGGRTEAEEPAPRDHGDSSDQPQATVGGEAKGAVAKGRPAEGQVAKAAEAEGAASPAKADIPAQEAGTKPATLDAPQGDADDLKRIKGIGPKLEKLCNRLGFWHFSQIAAWTADEVAWVDQNLEGFRGRVTRDDWVGQAKILASGGSTDFASRVDKGGVYNP